MRIKICGISTAAGGAAVARAGADAVGFVFAASERRVSAELARQISSDLPSSIERVAVFRLADVDDVRRVLDVFAADRVQVEPTAPLLAASRASLLPPLLPVLHDDGTLREQARALADPAGIHPVLVEGPGRGGRGVRPDWTRVARLARSRRVILAGGLDPVNVSGAIELVRPYGVDVSSGVEDAPGRKSAARIRDFVDAVKACAPVGAP